MSDEIYGKLIKHHFEVNAAQAVQDKQSMEDAGYYTPNIYFSNDPEGLWSANELKRFIKKMGYDAEIAIDPVQNKTYGHCQLLQVGKIPQTFLEDIKDFISMREAQLKKGSFALWIEQNGQLKRTGETAMMEAFKNIKVSQSRRKSGDGGVKPGMDAP